MVEESERPGRSRWSLEEEERLMELVLRRRERGGYSMAEQVELLQCHSCFRTK